MSLAAAAREQPAIVVRGPTVVAFFPPVKEEEIKANPDTNEALADFQLYPFQVREPFRKAGFAFHEVYAVSFRIHIGTRITTFRAGQVKVGYYFIAPGKEARVEYGVMTDGDLLRIAGDYLGGTAHQTPGTSR
jgi:hypothetical protein